MSLSIVEVNKRHLLRKFIAFPNKLFKNSPTYIPPLYSDEYNLLTKKNPSLEHSTCKLFLAYRDEKIVGRVAAIINNLANERWNRKSVRFGWFDFVEDYDVFSILIEKVIEYGKENGMTEIEGPMGFNDMDKECWAIDNFDARQNITTLYNPEYYIKFIERKGFEIKCRWMQHVMPASQPIPDKVARINSLIQDKYHVRPVILKSRKEASLYAINFFHTLNNAFKDLYGFVPLTEKEIKVYAAEYFKYVNLDFANFVVDENNNIIAFGVAIPDLNDAYRKAKGHIFPFGWYHILKAFRKFDTIDLLLNGVDPSWQKRGVHSIYYSFMNKMAIAHNVKTAYSNPQIVGNEAVKIWSTQYKAEPLMQRAVFGRNI